MRLDGPAETMADIEGEDLEVKLFPEQFVGASSDDEPGEAGRTKRSAKHGGSWQEDDSEDSEDEFDAFLDKIDAEGGVGESDNDAEESAPAEKRRRREVAAVATPSKAKAGAGV